MVIAQETAQPVATLHLASGLANMVIRFDKRVVQALVVAFPVIVDHELFYSTTKMILTQRDHLAQAFLFDRSHKAFGVCVCLRYRLHPVRTMRWECFGSSIPSILAEAGLCHW